jgi:DNA-binding transcriptional MocR family regulator
VGLARPIAHIVARAAGQWVSGLLDQVVRAELTRRGAALRRLAPARLRDSLLLRPGGFFAALRVDDEDAAVHALAEQGIRVTPGRSLRLDDGAGVPFIRLCVGASSLIARSAGVLAAVASAMPPAQPPAPPPAVPVIVPAA